MAVFSATAGATGGVKLKNPTTDAVAVAVAGVEASYTFPAGTAFFRMQGKKHGMDVYWTSGQTEVMTIHCGTMYWSPGLDTSQTFTIYFKTKVATETIQIEYWS